VQRLVLELAAALLADADPRRDLRVGLDAMPSEPVAAQQHLAVTRGQDRDQRPHAP
jgi:hypothetical protein